MHIHNITLYMLIFMLILIPSVPVDAASAECMFYDDFENGDAFWDYGSYRTMRIIDGKMSSDVYEGVCSVNLRGETTKWDDFVMDTVFETDKNDGWFGIYIRSGTESAIQLIIHKNGFYTIPSPVSGGNCAYSFETGKQYLMRISAVDKIVNVQIKAADEAQFACQWTGTYNTCNAGKIGFGSYLTKSKIDSVKITQTVTEPVYLNNKFIEILQDSAMQITPITTTGVDSIGYSCSGDTFTVDNNGNVSAASYGNGYGVLTVTAVTGSITYTAKCDLARKVPVTFMGTDKFYKMTVGETKNIKVYINPENATNKDLIWQVDNPEAIELVGDTEASIGIRALKPAKNVRVIAKSKDNPQITYKEYITVEGKPSQIKVQKFEPNGKVREIPYGMFGVSMAIPLNNATTREELIEYDVRHFPYMRDMKIQQLRMCFENYDCTIGNIAGSGKNFKYSVADIFSNANALDIPINISLNEYYDSAEKIITLANEIKKVTDKEICFGIWEECYDGRMINYSGWNVITAKDYTDFLKEIYPKIKAAFPDGSVKVGATVIDYPSYLTFGNGVGTSMISTWNHRIAEAKDYYDAVVIHHYSGTDSTTKGMMEGYAVSAAELSEGITTQTKMFEGKEFWMNEWGDLPTQVFFENLQSTQARNQYMKSLGSAIGYLQRQLEMTENEAVKMSAYHVYRDSMGFGILQEVGDKIYKMPSYYMFSMIGDVFEKNSHIYSLDFSHDEDLYYMTDTSRMHRATKGTYMVETSLMNGWAFGDENNIKEAVFANSSEYSVKAYIPGYALKKTMTYGNGENPLPDLAVNSNDKMTDLPSDIPLPEFYENQEYENYLIVPPYGICRATVSKTEPVWTTAFEDDFSSGSLDKWSTPGEFENIDGKMAVNVFNNTIMPKTAPASENISVSFDLQNYIHNFYVKFYDADNPSDCFFVTANDKLLWDITQVWDGKHNEPEYWHGFGRGISSSGTKSIKYEIKDGVLTQYMKDDDGTDFSSEHITGFYSYEIPGHYIKKYKKYSVGFYCIGEQSTVEGYNKAKAAIDNVVIQVPEEPNIQGTQKIIPVYKTVFEDDFSSGKLKWTGSTDQCTVTDSGILSISGYNCKIIPDAVISSETLEVEYDTFGNPKFMLLEFYNTENPSDFFRVMCNDENQYNTAQVTNFKDIWHNFGAGIETDKWQTIKFRINDGLIEMYVKDSSMSKFVEREHRVGTLYSSLWYNEKDENVSLLKKGVKYGVKIYMYKYNQDSGDLLIDNFKIRAVPTTVSKSAYSGDIKLFDINDIKIETKTDSGYELTAEPVYGTKNKFTLKAQGDNICGKAIVSIYDGNKLINVALSDISTVTETEIYIPQEIKNPKLQLMLWESLQSCNPIGKIIN